MTVNKKVFITGAGGRIGKVLMQGLPDLGWQLQGGDIVKSPGLRDADITNLTQMREAFYGCRSVIHLAAVPDARSGWHTTNELNVCGLRTVLEAARLEGVDQFIYASSIHVVGGHLQTMPLTHELPSNPSGTYGASKVFGESLIQVYARKTNMRATSVRICSFLERPTSPRHLKSWLSFQDAVALFDCCLRDDSDGYHMIWGVSANKHLEIVDPVADRLGYSPLSDGSLFEAEVSDESSDSENATWGGPYVTDRISDFLD